MLNTIEPHGPMYKSESANYYEAFGIVNYYLIYVLVNWKFWNPTITLDHPPSEKK